MSAPSAGCVTREGGQHGQPARGGGTGFPVRSLRGMALPGHSWLPPPGLVLTLCRVLALAERVSIQHVLAAGTPVGEQKGLWDPSVAMPQEGTPGVGGRQSGSRGLADG